MWVNKYAPTQSKNIVGGCQVAGTLSKWLCSWTRNQPKKAIVLSGQPGVGKTLTVNIVLHDLEYDTIELNASAL